MRPSRWVAAGFWMLWLYLVARIVTGWIQPRPEKSLLGTWARATTRIECRADGSVRSHGTTSHFLTWRGPHLVFHEAELTQAILYNPDREQWDLVLARQCGILRTSDQDFLSGPHVSHRKAGDGIEVDVRWDGRSQFELDGERYTKEETDAAQ